MERRTFLKTTGGIAGAIALGSTLVNTGAASNVDVSANNVSLENDDGVVKRVYINPKLKVSWEDLDNAVGAVSMFVEARVTGAAAGPNDGGFSPLLRAQPALLPSEGSGVDTSTPSTTGAYNQRDPTPEAMSNLTDNRVLGGNSYMGTGWSPLDANGGLILADREVGRPDYSATSEAYQQGGNVFDDTIEEVGDTSELLNGEYGAAANAAAFDVDTDGTSEWTNVDVRYTIQLLRPSLDCFTAVTGRDPVSASDNGTIGGVRDKLQEWYDASAGEWNVDDGGHLSDVMPRDITVVAFDGGDDNDEFTTEDDGTVYLPNQALPVMMGPDQEYPYFAQNPAGRNNVAARKYLDNDEPDYPGFLTQTVSFGVGVTNEEAAPNDTSSEGSTNGTVEGDTEED